MKAQDIIREAEAAQGRRGQHDNRLEALSRYFMVSDQGFQSGHAEGEQLNEQVYDSHGAEAAEQFANFIWANTMGASADAFRVTARSEEAKENDLIAKELERRNLIMHAEIEESNLASEGPETVLGLLNYGTASLRCTEKNDFRIPDGEFKGLSWRNEWLEEVCFKENADGDVDRVFQTHEYYAHQAIEEYGEDKVCKEIRDAAKEGQETKFKFIVANYPRYYSHEDYLKGTNGLNPVPANKKPYASVHVCKLSQEIVRESGYDTPPRYVVRWRRCNAWGDGYGYGLGDKAYPSVKVLNRATKLEERAWEKNIDPGIYSSQDNIISTTTSDGVFPGIDHAPGSNTEVRDINGIRPKNEGTNWQLAFVKREELVNTINQIFHMNEITLPEPGQANMTAYEVSRRLQMMMQSIGGSLGRLKGLWSWAVMRTYSMMDAKGVFGEWPEGTETELDIEFLSPLMRASDAQTADSTNQWVMMLVEFARAQMETTGGSDVLDNVDSDEYARDMARAFGVPEDILKDQEERDAGRQERQQAQEAQQKAATLKDASQSVANFADARSKAAG